MAPESSGNTTGDFNPFGPKEPTPGRHKRKPHALSFWGDRIIAWHLWFAWFSHLQICYLPLLRYRLSDPIALVSDCSVASAAMLNRYSS